MSFEPRLRRPVVLAVAVLAVLAYVPALTAAPGRMPADSKLYLYLDPGRFLVDAASTFDARQFAGWVPHQHVAYLWPSGPWYWLFEALAVPDWIAHRLWIGTLMLAAGLGVRWTARLVGLSATAALTAAVVYQLSLFVVPYVSRTSVLLLPWAGLGWIVAFTIRSVRRGGWADPAAVALIVATVGAVNATALVMIVPGPVLWLIHVAWQRVAPWRTALVVAVRIGALCLALSVWWIAMLLVQSRHGTDVLPYSESLGDVSLTSTAPEVWRSLGYWLFYVRDPYAAATTESLRYLSSSWSIVISYLVPVLVLCSLAFVSWANRRYSALLIGTGLVLAVGVHPNDDRSPLMQLLVGDDESGLALALRSSTRALPLVALGSALAVAAGVESLRDVELTGRSLHRPAAWAVSLIAIANLPALWTGGFVDPALERDATPPDAWLAAADRLDEIGSTGRVLQLPGAEFGAFRWGYTVDQPLPGLTEKPLVTRDLLPLGSPGAMDLLFALDDRAQSGILEPDAVAPAAALLGADTIWLANDLAFDRFRTARPEVVRDLVVGAPGAGEIEAFGTPEVNTSDVPVVDEHTLGDPRVGEAQPLVELVRLDHDATVVRARSSEFFVAGSGDGLIDAVAAGLLDPGAHAVRYTADLDDLSQLDDALGVIITDSNRDRARHWRSSQDTVGYTEPGGSEQDVLRPVASDVRLDVFTSGSPDTQTRAVQEGTVTATATAYGEPFAYLPEHRAFAAIDGDPDTAWIVGEHGDPIGETIRLDSTEPLDRLVLHQPVVPGDRKIVRVTYSTLDSEGKERRGSFDLDESSWDHTGQTIAVEPFVSIELTIDAVAGGTPFTGSAVAGVGFAEIEHGAATTVEVVTPPQRALAELSGDVPLAMVLTRLRHDPMDRWRDDTEASIVRSFDLPTDRRMTLTPTVRIDARADDAALAALFGWEAVASTRLTGAPRHAGLAAIDGDPDTSWITAFGEARGATLSVVATEPVREIAITQPRTNTSVVTEVTLRTASDERRVMLSTGADGVARGRVEPPVPAGAVDFVLSGLEESITRDRRFGDPVELPAVVTEIEYDGRARVEGISARTATVGECVPLADISGVPVAVTLAVVDDGWLDGAPIDAVPCEPAVDLPAGVHRLIATDVDQPITLDRIVLDDRIATLVDERGDTDRPEATLVSSDRFARDVEVSECERGCWLIVGEGHNDAWTAHVDGDDLGAPTLVDGGFNGWRLDGASVPRTVEVRWTAQTGQNWAFATSLAGAFVAVFLIASDLVRRRSRAEPTRLPTVSPVFATGPGWSRRTAMLTSVGLIAGSALLIEPIWAVWGALLAAAIVISRRPRLPELTALATVAVVAVVVTVRERRLAPPPNGAWPGTFESLHAFGMFAIVCVLVAALSADDAAAATAEPDADASDQ